MYSIFLIHYSSLYNFCAIGSVLDFAEQIIKNPDLLDEIPEGSVITFLDDENVKSESLQDKKLKQNYVKVKRSFEVF